MSIKNKYSIQSIDNYLCKEWLLKKHYAKRSAPIDYAFGLYAENILKGVITFGTPCGKPIREIFNGDFKVIELNRLCVNDGLEKNTLSFFVSASMNKLPKPLVIVSYADIKQNHVGYIYQATNFIYTGLSADRKDWKIKGMEHLHSGTIADMSRGQKDRAGFMRKTFGENFYLEQRSRKHRYFYFTGNKNDIKKMMLMLPYKIEPYPKGESLKYDSSFSPTIQLKLI